MKDFGEYSHIISEELVEMKMRLTLIEFLGVLAAVAMCTFVFLVPELLHKRDQEVENRERMTLMQQEGKVKIKPAYLTGSGSRYQFSRGTMEIDGLVLRVLVTEIRDQNIGQDFDHKIIPAKGKAEYSFVP